MSSLSLDEFKTLAATGTSQDHSRFFRNSFTNRWWPYLQNHMDVPYEHHLQRLMGPGGLWRLEGSVVHKNAVSPLRTVRTFVLNLTLVQKPVQQLGLAGDLRPFLLAHEVALPKDCRISVRLNPREQDPRVAEDAVVAGMVQPWLCPPAHVASVPVAGDYVATCSCAA